MGAVLKAQEHYRNQLRTVWHPSPMLDLIPTNHATIRVLAGVVRGQLSSGQYIDL